MNRVLSAYTLVFFILISTLSSCTKFYHIKTEEEKEREMVLKNNIKSITEYRTAILLGVKQNELTSRLREFDESGFKTQEIQYTLTGVMDATLSFQYDSAGNLILINALNGNNSFLFKEAISYEGKNRKELHFYLPDGTYKYRNVATYDKQGRMTELAWYWPDGFKSKNKYLYDGEKKIEDTEYDRLGNFSYRWNYKYDHNENLIEAVQHYPGNVMSSKRTYEYDKDNMLIKQASYNGEQLNGFTIYEYDSKNHLTKMATEFSGSGRITALIRYVYQQN